MVTALVCYTGVTCDRYWLLYFNSRYNMANAQGEWMALVDPALSSESTRNWFVRRKPTLGSGPWTFKWLFCPTVAASLLVSRCALLWAGLVHHELLTHGYMALQSN